MGPQSLRERQRDQAMSPAPANMRSTACHKIRVHGQGPSLGEGEGGRSHPEASYAQQA